MKLISDEAESFFQESQIPVSKRKVIKDAVVMAVDAGLILNEQEE
jgi:hypothetical protein